MAPPYRISQGMTDPAFEASASLMWHALLAPLPADAAPRRQPVASPAVLASPEGRAVAGWEQLVLYLSAGAAGSRTILVVLDAGGTLLSAGDAVLYRSGLNNPSPPPENEPALIRQESVGGRFEPDGSFHGTRWQSVTIDRGEAELDWESTSREPTPEDVDALRQLVTEVIRRRPEKARPT
jgi:hypothetical protein